MSVNLTKLLTTLFLSIACLTSFQAIARCDSPQHRQFDFWVGEWQVSNKQNSDVSQSKISLINNGCGILEEYTTTTGYQGKSLNIYDATTLQWHQTWIDNGGTLLQLDGKFEQGKMTLSGVTHDSNGKEVLNKIMWTPNADGTVRQQWLVSNDQGKKWQSIFDGMYKKVAN
mgnify:CR=1 FL=1